MSVGQSVNAYIGHLSQSLSSNGSESVFYLDSIKSLTGETLSTADFATFGKGTITIDPLSTTNIEFCSFTAVDGSAISFTGGVRGLSAFDYTASTARAKYHPVGTTVIIAFGVHNLLDLVNYVAGQVAGTIGTTTNLVSGSTKLSVAAASAPNPIAVGDNDPRLVAATLATTVGNLLFPIGSLYTATVSTNPNTLLGFGTWSAYGAGRVLIGAGTGTKVATFASRSSNVITVTGLTNAANNEFQTGQAVVYSAPSGAMTGLTSTNTYYIIRTGNLTFSLASSLANAQNGTAISLSSDGTGTQTFTLTLTARTAGDTGGEENHAMSATELLAHTHTAGNYVTTGALESNNGYPNSAAGPTGSTGGNAAMNVMNPFITVYIWNRTA